MGTKYNKVSDDNILKRPFKIPSKRNLSEDLTQNIQNGKTSQKFTDPELPNIQINASGNNIKVDVHITITKLDE